MNTFVSRIKPSNLNPIQRDIHDPDLTVKNDQGEDEINIVSIFYFKNLRSLPSLNEICLLDGTTSDSGKVSYKITKNYSQLINSFLHVELPALRVKAEFKDELKICWPPNIGLLIKNHGSLLFGDVNIQMTDTYSDLFMCEYFLDGSKRDSYKQMVGNVPELTEFSTFIPRYDLFMPQFFFYSSDISKSIPLFLFPSVESVKHNYEFNLRIGDFLRILQKNKDTGQWDHIKFSQCLNKIEGYNGHMMIPSPKLYGEFCFLTDYEMSQRMNNLNYTIYSFDFIPFESTNPQSLNTAVSITYSTSRPVQYIISGAENVDSIDILGVHHNFSTDLNSNGHSPIRKVGIRFKDETEFIELSAKIFEKVMPFTRNGTDLSSSHLLFFPYSYIPMNYQNDTDRNFSQNCEFIYTLEDTDPYLCPVEGAVEKQPVTTKMSKFKIISRVLTTRKLLWKLDIKHPTNSLLNKFVFVVDEVDLHT